MELKCVWRLLPINLRQYSPHQANTKDSPIVGPIAHIASTLHERFVFAGQAHE